MGFFDKIKKIGIFNGFSQLDDDFYEELEESLVMADLGAETTVEAVEELRSRCKAEKIKDMEGARQCMRDILAEYLSIGDLSVDMSRTPAIVLFIGVNGVGKTTSIGKLAARWKREGKKVLLCAGDTFRAAAAEQLTIWSERAGVDIVKQHEGADPAAVVYDALSAARARKSDVVLVDDDLVELLQQIRDHFRAPVIINSGYRSPARDQAVGGVDGSQHTKGTAADIVVRGVSPLEVAQYAEHLMPDKGADE